MRLHKSDPVQRLHAGKLPARKLFRCQSAGPALYFLVRSNSPRYPGRACFILYAYIVAMRRTTDDSVPAPTKQDQRFLLVSLVIYFAPVFLVNDYLDRYILPAIPITLLALFLISNRSSSKKQSAPKSSLPNSIVGACFALIAGFALFSVLGTKDYLSYYRTAWIARQYVVDQGVQPDLVFNVPDWGPAYFDGGYLNDAEMAMNGPVPHADSGYDVGTSVKPGYSVVKQYPIYLRLNRREITMYVSKRQ